MSPVDVNTCIGGVPYRAVPHPEPAVLARVLAREHVRGAWVGDLPSAFAEDPHARNDALFDALAPFAGVLAPVITVHPARPAWDAALARGLARGAVAVRTYGAAASAPLAAACGRAGVPLMLTASLERATPAEFSAAGTGAIRNALRVSARVRVIVCGAGGALIRDTERALADDERARLWWEISQIAGPPRDDLASLFTSLGARRFLYGSGWPLRLTQVPKANLALLPAELEGTPLADVEDVRRG